MIPDWVPQGVLDRDSEYWEELHLVVLPWQTLQGSNPARLRRRVLLRIRDFPIDFWHPTYFRQATTSMGVMVGFAADTLTSGDMARVLILLDCYDTTIIPPSIHIFHADQFTECLIDFEAWPEVDGPLPPHPPPPDQGGFNNEDGGTDPTEQDSPPYVPPWRRGLVELPVPQIDPNRRMAPAAEQTLEDERSTVRAPAPALGNSVLACPLTPDRPLENKPSSHGIAGQCKQKNESTLYKDTCLHPEPSLASKGIILPNLNPSIPKRLAKHASQDSTPFRPLYQRRFQSFPHLNTCPSKSEPLSSILGAHPSSISSSHILAAKYTPLSHYSSSSIQSKLLSSQMASITPEDEALIQRFVGLSTGEGDCDPVQLALEEANGTAWDRCLLLRVVTDRTVLDGPFVNSMLKAWRTSHETSIRQISRGSYLAQFVSKEEMQSVQLGGPWVYRGDIVAMERVGSEEELRAVKPRIGEVWVQLFNLPFDNISDAGINKLVKQLGMPVSALQEGFSGGEKVHQN